MYKQSFPWLMSGQTLGNIHHIHTCALSNRKKDRAFFNGLSCCQNVWYALATDSSGLAGSTVCECMWAYACEHAHKHKRRGQKSKESYSHNSQTRKSLIMCDWKTSLNIHSQNVWYWMHKWVNVSIILWYIHVWFNWSEMQLSLTCTHESNHRMLQLFYLTSINMTSISPSFSP